MKRSSFDWLSVRGASLFPAATGPVAGAGRSVHAAENGAERFALFFGRLVGGVAYGHKHHGFLVGRKGKEADTVYLTKTRTPAPLKYNLTARCFGIAAIAACVILLTASKHKAIRVAGDIISALGWLLSRENNE